MTSPATTSNQITYEYFCVLGGLSDPRTFKRMKTNGNHFYFTYHLISTM